MNNVQRTQNLESLPKTQLALSYGIAGVFFALIVMATASSPETMNWGRWIYIFAGVSLVAVALAGLINSIYSLKLFIKYYVSLRNSARIWGFVALLLAAINIVAVGILWVPLFFYE